MQAAVRPNLAAAGAALIGASVVAASTIAPPPEVHLPDIHAPAVVERVFDVSLTAAANPLAAYSHVVQAALTNINSLIESAEPGRVLGEVLANQSTNLGQALGAVGVAGGAVAGAAARVPAVLLTAAGQLAGGNIAGATDTLLQLPLQLALPLTNVLPALANLITRPLQNVVNVVNAFTSDQLGTILAFSGFIAPLISTPAAAAVAVQNVVTAVASLNPAAIVNAALTAPATIADGLLNGGYGPDLAGLVGLEGVKVFAGGLLSATGLSIGDDGSIVVNTGGPLAALQQVLAKIAGAIAAPPATTVKLAATDATSIPSATPHTVSLAPAASTTKPAETTAAETTPAETKPTKTATATDTTATDDTTAEAKPADTKPADTKAEPIKADEAKADEAKTDEAKADEAKPAKGVDVRGGNKVSPSPTKTSESTSSKSGGDSAAAAHETHGAADADAGAAPSKDAA